MALLTFYRRVSFFALQNFFIHVIPGLIPGNFLFAASNFYNLDFVAQSKLS